MVLILQKSDCKIVCPSLYLRRHSILIRFLVRSGLSIVPQSPDLFEGTLRENIDPVGEYSDNDIWVALDQVHLKSYVEELEGKLDTPVREGGSSLSSGQRQLLCFARALLKKVGNIFS